MAHRRFNLMFLAALAFAVAGGAHAASNVPVDARVYGVTCNGTTDDTAALQAAINSGQAIQLPPGTCKTSATLTISPPQSGMSVLGAHRLGSFGNGSGATTIKPTSSVSIAIGFTGTAVSTSGYLTNVTLSDLSIDMANMSEGTVAIQEILTWGDTLSNIQVINYGNSKRTLDMLHGAYGTVATNLWGSSVFCYGAGGGLPGGDPTTLTLINPGITELNQENCASVTTVGGAVQPNYVAGVTTVQYIAPGSLTNLLGFYPTTTALWAYTGGTDNGLYIALGSYAYNAQDFSSIGTDWEIATPPPATCSITGSSWAYGTYNDGTHGCAPVVMVANDIEFFVQGCIFDNPIFAGEYLHQPQVGGGCDVRGFPQGTSSLNMSTRKNIFSGRVDIWNAQPLYLYSDAGVTQTGLIDASTGAFTLRGGTFRPATDGTYLAFQDAAGDLVGYVNTNVSAAAAILAFPNFIASNGTYTAALLASNGSFTGNGSYLRPAADETNAFTVLNRANNHAVFDVFASATDTSSLVAVSYGASLSGYSSSVGTGQTFRLNAATGVITGASYVAGSSAGVSCAAGTVNLTTIVITGGIVTHC